MLSRVFAIAWALCGLVVIAILTGKITAALTDYKHLETNMKLYGAEVSNEPYFTGYSDCTYGKTAESNYLWSECSIWFDSFLALY